MAEPSNKNIRQQNGISPANEGENLTIYAKPGNKEPALIVDSETGKVKLVRGLVDPKFINDYVDSRVNAKTQQLKDELQELRKNTPEKIDINVTISPNSWQTLIDYDKPYFGMINLTSEILGTWDQKTYEVERYLDGTFRLSEIRAKQNSEKGSIAVKESEGRIELHHYFPYSEEIKLYGSILFFYKKRG